jgi:hypothetical protein
MEHRGQPPVAWDDVYDVALKEFNDLDPVEQGRRGDLPARQADHAYANVLDWRQIQRLPGFHEFRSDQVTYFLSRFVEKLVTAGNFVQFPPREPVGTAARRAAASAPRAAAAPPMAAPRANPADGYDEDELGQEEKLQLAQEYGGVAVRPELPARPARGAHVDLTGADMEYEDPKEYEVDEWGDLPTAVPRDTSDFFKPQVVSKGYKGPSPAEIRRSFIAPPLKKGVVAWDIDPDPDYMRADPTYFQKEFGYVGGQIPSLPVTHPPLRKPLKAISMQLKARNPEDKPTLGAIKPKFGFKPLTAMLAAGVIPKFHPELLSEESGHLKLQELDIEKPGRPVFLSYVHMTGDPKDPPVLVWQMQDGTIVAENGFTLGRAYTSHLRLKKRYFDEHPTRQMRKAEKYTDWYKRIQGDLPHKDGPWLFCTAMLGTSLLHIFGFKSHPTRITGAGDEMDDTDTANIYRYGEGNQDWVHLSKKPYLGAIKRFIQKHLYHCVVVRLLLFPFMGSDPVEAGTYDIMKDAYEILARNRDLIWNLYVHVLIMFGRRTAAPAAAAAAAPQGDPILMRAGRFALTRYLVNLYRKRYKLLLDSIFVGPNRGKIANVSFDMTPEEVNGVLSTDPEIVQQRTAWEEAHRTLYDQYPNQFYEANHQPNAITALVRGCIGVRGQVNYDFRPHDGDKVPPTVPRLRTVLRALQQVRVSDLDPTLQGPDAAKVFQPAEEIKLTAAQLPLLSKIRPPLGGWFIEAEDRDKDWIEFPGLAEELAKAHNALTQPQGERWPYMKPAEVPRLTKLCAKAAENNKFVWDDPKKHRPQIVEPHGKNPVQTAYMLKKFRNPAAGEEGLRQDEKAVLREFSFGPEQVPKWKEDEAKYYQAGKRRRGAAINPKFAYNLHHQHLIPGLQLPKYAEEAQDEEYAAPANELAKFRARSVPQQREEFFSNLGRSNEVTELRGRRGRARAPLIPYSRATYDPLAA